jgi:hypothetical protein
MKEHLPVRIYFRANGEANSYSLINQADDKWLLAMLVNGEHTTARQAEILEEMQRRWNTHDQLVAALRSIVKSLADQDDEGMIEHAQQMIDARAAIANATGSAA